LSLPHRFPFRLVDRAGERRALARWSASSYWQRGHDLLQATWLVEAAAQAAGLLLAQGPVEPTVLLAGVELAALSRPIRCGESVEIETRIAGRLGRLVRVEARATVAAEAVGELVLTLMQES